MSEYILSKQAETDLRNIAIYGIQQFGIMRAECYRDDLKDRLSQIAETPLRYPAIDHVSVGYRRSVFEAHSIYFRIVLDGVFIVRILGREDPSKAFQT